MISAQNQDWAHSVHGPDMSQVNGDPEARVFEHRCGSIPASRLGTSFGLSQKILQEHVIPLSSCLPAAYV